MARFHFALSHLPDADQLLVNIHGNIFDIHAHTRESFEDARRNHPVLSQMPDDTCEAYSHYADLPDEHLEGDAPRWVRVMRPKKPGAQLAQMVLMTQVIPPSRLWAFYHSPFWKERHTRRYGRHATEPMLSRARELNTHCNGRLYALGIPPDDAAGDRRIELLMAAQELVDTMSTAAGLVAHHPNLGIIQPSTAAYIRDTHILPSPSVNPNQYNAMQVLSAAIQKDPDWSPVINCTDHKGNPVLAQYDLPATGDSKVFRAGQQMQTYSLSDTVTAATTPAVGGAQQTTSDDLQLQNQIWGATPGTSALDGTATTTQARASLQALGDGEFKWTVPYQTYTDGIKLPINSLMIDSQNNFSIDVYNIYNRTLYAAYQLFDDAGNPLGDRVDLGSITAVNSLLGIPLPFMPTTEAFNIGQAAEVRLYLGSLGTSNWDQASWGAPNVSSHGTMLTCVWQYGVPMIFLIAGKVLTSTTVLNKITKNPKVVKLAIEILGNIVGTSVDNVGATSGAGGWILSYANAALTFIGQKGMESFGEYITEQIAEGELESSWGPVGTILKLVAAGLDVELMAITTAEVLSSSALRTASIKRAIDVSLTLHPDPAHGEAGNSSTAVWPSVAVNYVATLQCKGGTNFVLKGNLPSTTSGTPVPLTFSNIPAGGDFRIFFGVYSANGWLAGSWQNDWTPAVANQGTTLALGDENIKENLVPLGIDTQYVYKEKIVYANTQFSWANSPQPPATTLQSLNCANNGALCELTAITVNNSAFQIGYAWRAANQHLHPDSPTAPVSDNQLYAVQNLSVLQNPSSRLKTTSVGFTQKPGIAYAMSINDKNTIDQTNFVLDPRGTAMQLRQVLLGEGTPSDFGLGNTLPSWGSFSLNNLDAMAIHPSNAVVACSFENHKLLILDLPASPSSDDKAVQARIVSGKGVREGLMQGPKALVIAPDGRILVLESLNNRVQAFDVLGNPVPSFTPNPYIFTLKTSDVASALDAGTTPTVLIDALVNAGENFVAPLPNNSFIAQLDSGKFQPQNDPLIQALGTLNINLAYDPDNLSDPTQSAQIQVVTAGQSWIITDPRSQAWQVLNQSGMLNIYQRSAAPTVLSQIAGNRWLVTDSQMGPSWILQVSSGNPTLVEVFDCFSYFPLQTGPNGNNLNYLDMAVEAQGYMYVLSYQNDGSATTDYLLDVYAPDGTFLFRSPDSTKTLTPQNIVAGRISVDIWRDLYALTYETLNGPNGALQPGVAHWMPTPPLFSFPLTEQPNFNAQNISAIVADFAAHNIHLSNQAFILVINPDGYWQVKDGTTIYHVYRTGGALQVYNVPA